MNIPDERLYELNTQLAKVGPLLLELGTVVLHTQKMLSRIIADAVDPEQAA